jgi:signal transduction histidine kinase
MRTYFYALNKNKEHLFDNFPEELIQYINENIVNSIIIKCVIGGKTTDIKIAKRENEHGIIFIATSELKFLKREKSFKDFIDFTTVGIKPFINFQRELEEKHNKINEEFIHNVISLNTHAIQDLFTLLPQQSLSDNIYNQLEYARSIIKEKPKIAAETLLKLIKYHLASKVEFSVFSRTLKTSTYIHKKKFYIHKVLLTILQIFISDFEKKNITIHLDASEKQLEIDFDSLFVSLYYIFENAIKYCHPSTTFKIIFKEESNCFSILFEMISIKIQKYEVDKIILRGYRSEIAKNINSEGNGIGLYRIIKTLQLNNCELEIKPNFNSVQRVYKNNEYEGNIFKIKFLGQQDWFKT